MKSLNEYISNDMKSFKTSLEESLLDDGDELVNKIDKTLTAFDTFVELVTDAKSYRKLSQGTLHFELNKLVTPDIIDAIFEKIGIKDVENFSIMIKKIEEYVGWGDYEQRWEFKLFIYYKHGSGFSNKTTYKAKGVSFPKLLKTKIRNIFEDPKLFKLICQSKIQQL